MKYNQPFGTPADSPYINGDPSIGRAGSIPPAETFEYPQREIINFLTSSGLTPVDTDLTQLGQAVQSGKVVYGADIGVVNMLTVELDPTPVDYYPGMTIRVVVAHDITGPAQMRIASLPFKWVVSNSTLGMLLRNDLQAGHIAEFTYDGTLWRLMTGSPSEVVRTALFPQAEFFNAAGSNYVPPAGGPNALGGWGAGVGDPNIAAAFDLTTGLFTVPGGLGGLWDFEGYVNSLTAPTAGFQPAQGLGLRLYKGTVAGGTIFSAMTSPAATIVHAFVKSRTILADGQQMQIATVNNNGVPADATLTFRHFSACRFGRAAP
jgi:hypothetical protein